MGSDTSRNLVRKSVLPCREAMLLALGVGVIALGGWSAVTIPAFEGEGQGRVIEETSSIETTVLGTRETAALADLVTLRDAEAIVELDTGYYTSLENLDDLPGINLVEPRDGILDGGGAWMLDPATGDWYPSRLDLDRAPFIWKGPYVNFQQKADDDGAGYDPGTPLDPWGRPYLLYSPLGLARPPIPEITLELHGDRFDRWYLVCLGADGVVSDDDLGVAFGTAPWQTVVSSIRLIEEGGTAALESGKPMESPKVLEETPEELSTSVATAVSWSLEIRGYNLGDGQGDAAVYVDGERLTTAATQWSATRAIQPLPPDLVPGTHDVFVRFGSTDSRVFSFEFVGVETAVHPRLWSLYP